MFLDFILPGIITITCVVIVYIWKKNRYFLEHGIAYENPEPIFGNVRKAYFSQEHMNDLLDRLYTRFSKDSYVGIYNLFSPVILVKDQELLKKILIKDFEHFVDHMEFTDETVDPLNGKSLFALKGDRWKEMRTSLSPAFTSSKMRGMMPLMEKTANNFVNFIRMKVNEKSSRAIGYAEFNMKDPFTRYSNDVIASCGFGIEINSFTDENNTFYRMVKELTNFDIQVWKLVVFFLFPPLAKWLKLEFTSKRVANFIRELVKNNMDERERNKIVRPDMIHLLMLAKQGKLHDPEDQEANQKVKRDWTHDELTAQVMLFLLAGFDTTSNLLCFMSYELAVNPDIQAKLIKEIEDVLEKNGGVLTYTDMQSMKYLDMVTNETLRMWPGISNTDRVCVKDYELPPPNDSSTQKYKLKKGDGLWIPTFAIQRDPNLFDQPNKFIPERFSDENKSKISPLSYIAFGSGPRACIGSRFALMEVKLLMCTLLKEFEFVQTPKTPIPMIIKPHVFNFIPVNGFMIGIKSRNM